MTSSEDHFVIDATHYMTTVTAVQEPLVSLRASERMALWMGRDQVRVGTWASMLISGVIHTLPDGDALKRLYRPVLRRPSEMPDVSMRDPALGPVVFALDEIDMNLIARGLESPKHLASALGTMCAQHDRFLVWARANRVVRRVVAQRRGYLDAGDDPWLEVAAVAMAGPDDFSWLGAVAAGSIDAGTPWTQPECYA